MKIRLPKFGIIYTYYKDNQVTARLGLISTKYRTYLQKRYLVQLPYLEISTYLPVAYIDENRNNLIFPTMYQQEVL